MPEPAPMLTDITDLKEGQYIVTTFNGTRHVFDMEHKLVRRYGAPGREWNGENGHFDHVPFRFRVLVDVRLGNSFLATNENGEWRQSSEIMSIEKLSVPWNCRGNPRLLDCHKVGSCRREYACND